MGLQPATLEEWEFYVRSLLPEELSSKARAMNRVQFIRMLEEEGLEVDAIENIFGLFGRRFIELGIEPPMGGLVDLKEIV